MSARIGDPLGAALSLDTTQKKIRVTRRLDLQCESIGFARPPCGLDLMFIKGKGRWTLIVHCAWGHLLEVDRWLRRYGPSEVSFGSGSAPTVLRAEFMGTVACWSEILQAVRVRCLQLTPTGLASLFYEDDDMGIPLLLRDMRRGAIDAHVRPSLGGRDASRLTLSQYEVLSLAVALGYYDSTPRADQREMAIHLGIPALELSELLSRGEANVVTSHVDAFMMTRMHDVSVGLGPDAKVEHPAHHMGMEGDRGRVRQSG